MPENRKYEQHGLLFDISWNVDADADLSYLDCMDDRERLAAYDRDEWTMVYCTVLVRVQTATNWSVPNVIGRASLSNIESDSGAAYFAEVEKDLAHEALIDARATLASINELKVLRPEPLEMTPDEMQREWNRAMGILIDLSYQEGFNDAVANGGRYELDKSFDDFVLELAEKVRFIPEVGR